MQIVSFKQDITYHEEKVAVKVMLETAFSKEIRLLFRKGQQMQEHKAPFPIIVHVLKGAIDFGVGTSTHLLKEGDVISLDAYVLHDLRATEDSMLRLTLLKSDRAERVESIANA